MSIELSIIIIIVVVVVELVVVVVVGVGVGVVFGVVEEITDIVLKTDVAVSSDSRPSFLKLCL